MRIGRHLLGGTACAVIFALLLIWLLPPRLDWNRYRGSFEQLAAAVLGRPVTIEGPISLSLLPTPMLTAGQVTVGDAGSRAAGSFSVDTMRLAVALGPLLAGHVDARELVLRKPALHLPWPLPAALWQLRAESWVSAVSARVEDGSVTVGGVTIDQIDGAFGFTDPGALSAAGTARSLGQTWRFGTRVAAEGDAGSLGLELALDADRVSAAFSGAIARDGTLAGQMQARGPDLSRFMPAPAIPFRAQGRLSAASGLAAADDLTVDLGGTPARGSVALRVSPAERLDVALTAGRIDLDPWLAALAQGDATSRPFGLDLSAEAATLRHGTLRRLRASFERTQDAVRLTDLSAVLPGEAALHLTGSAALEPGQPLALFDGTAVLDAPDLRTTIGWLGMAGFPVPGTLPPGVLHSAALAAHVTAGRGTFEARELHGTLDGGQLAGQVTVRAGAPMAVAADLAADRFDLDPWLPPHLPMPGQGVVWPSDTDTILHLTAHEAKVRGLRIDDAALAATTKAGRLDLQQLAGTVLGSRINAAGSITAEGVVADGKLTLTTDNAMALAGLAPPAWRGTAALWDGPAALDLTAAGAPSALGVRASLDLADARLEAQPTIDLGTGRWSGSVTLRHPGAVRLITTMGLPRSLGDPALSAWLGDGSLSLVAQVGGGPDRITADSFDLTAGSLRAGGTLTLDTEGAGPRLTGRIEAETLTVPLPDPRSADPLPVAALQGWQAAIHLKAATVLAGLMPAVDHLEADFAVGKGGLRIEHLTALAAGGVITGTVDLDGTARPPSLAVKAALTGGTWTEPLFGTPLDLARGRAQADLDAVATGYSPAALLASAEGQIRGAVVDGVLLGIDLPAIQAAIARAQAAGVPDLEAAVRAGLAGGSTDFSRLAFAADLSGGSLRLRDATLASGSGDIDAAGSLSLTDVTENLRLSLRPNAPDAPEIGQRFVGPIGAPSRSPELESLARWLVAHL